MTDNNKNQDEEIYFEIQIPEGDLDKGGEVGFKVLDKARGVVRALVGVPKQEFENTVNLVSYIGSQFQKQVNTLNPPPKRFSLEFGATLAKDKTLFFSAAKESHFKINIHWEQ